LCGLKKATRRNLKEKGRGMCRALLDRCRLKNLEVHSAANRSRLLPTSIILKNYVAAVSGSSDFLRSPFRRQSKSAAADFDHFKELCGGGLGLLRFP
jgi:hypothetical protein